MRAGDFDTGCDSGQCASAASTRVSRAERCAAYLAALMLVTSCARQPPAPSRPGDFAASTACFERVAGSLAADEMEGRGVGTEGLEAARRFLVERYAKLGLDRAVEGGYEQEFQAITGVAVGTDNGLRWGGESAELGVDFTPLGFSSSGRFSGPLVFAGYGLVAEPLGYDDYAELDVAGKVVLAMRFEPGEADADSPFDGRRPSRWSDLRYKALKAREAGAVALIFVDPPDADGEDRLPLLRQQGPISHAGLPVLQVKRALADRWLRAAGQDLATLHAAIDADYRPHSALLPSIEIEGSSDIRSTEAAVANVVGILPGQGELQGEAVVVGAHYDHLGYGGAGSLSPGSREVHNGADDNASGVAAMLCGVGGLVSDLAGRPGPRRTLVVVGFSAEEVGLGGSAWYVSHPAFPIEETVAMVNLDMVGRLRDRRLHTLGSDSAPQWEPLLRRAARGSGLKVALGGDGYGPSDQMSFYNERIPVVHLFTGAHREYHTPADDADTLNIEGGARVAAFLQGVLEDLIGRSERLAYQPASSGMPLAGDSRSFGSYLGTIPDYTQMMASEGGVRLTDVRKGGPAHTAGIRGGDRIVAMAGVEIQNLYDMTFVLRDHRPGEIIEIGLIRAGRRRNVRATLGRREPAPTESGGSPHGDSRPPDGSGSWTPGAGRDATHLVHARESHLADLRQLTFGGENAEAYFAPDGRRLVFQRTPKGGGCDQQYLLDLTSGEMTLLSSGRGRTTCGYFAYPKGDRLIYSTTEAAGADCPPKPDYSLGYVWPLHDYDMVWQSGPDAEPQAFLPHPAYDAEATVCMRDGRVVFTSNRRGDLDLYVALPDGKDLHQLTDTPGYDGGAFFTPDCSAIVWRASRPLGEALSDYRRLLSQKLVRPSALEIFWMDSDGSNPRQLTHNGRANFAPYPLPDSSGVIFSSNMAGSEREFDLFRVGAVGGEPERITFAEGFDGFPMFSPDGRWLVFASNRAAEFGDTNLFIARWIP